MEVREHVRGRSRERLAKQLTPERSATMETPRSPIGAWRPSRRAQPAQASTPAHPTEAIPQRIAVGDEQ